MFDRLKDPMDKQTRTMCQRISEWHRDDRNLCVHTYILPEIHEYLLLFYYCDRRPWPMHLTEGRAGLGCGFRGAWQQGAEDFHPEPQHEAERAN